MTTEELTTALFYEVDEQMRAIPKHPEARLWLSEVVTLGLLPRCGRAPRVARPTAVSLPGRGARGHVVAPRPSGPPGPCHLARGASIS
jgi:hypothetical protein